MPQGACGSERSERIADRAGAVLAVAFGIATIVAGAARHLYKCNSRQRQARQRGTARGAGQALGRQPAVPCKSQTADVGEAAGEGRKELQVAGLYLRQMYAAERQSYTYGKLRCGRAAWNEEQLYLLGAVARAAARDNPAAKAAVMHVVQSTNS